ncbi:MULTISPECIES: fimbrial protein [unclassified Pseudomonas]|uniref:fimbrial protein n=1 Tax=Pseudomonas TaxID=286 RepID=UPI0023D7C19D|nr:fimbrial protein [Pseudomonas sp. PSE14]WEJ72982.1 fimbrial protein [Pseudomonas sp. PSE14]
MKKILAAAGIFSCAANVYAAIPDAQINITGKVIDGTCTIAGTGSAPTQINVPLSSVMSSDFAAVGALSKNQKSFDIVLTNCPTATTTMKWDAAVNVDAAAGTLKNTNSSGTSAQIQLFKSDGTTAINLVNDPGVSFTTTSQTFTYVAKYYAKALPVTGGDLSTFTYLYLTYN